MILSSVFFWLTCNYSSFPFSFLLKAVVYFTSNINVVALVNAK